MRNERMCAAGTGLLLSLLAGTALAGPVELSLRPRGDTVELVMPGVEVRASLHRLEACAAVLRLNAPDGFSLDRVQTGAGRIRAVRRDADNEFTVQTACGASVELRRREAEVALVVGAVSPPRRKPGDAFPLVVAAAVPMASPAAAAPVALLPQTASGPGAPVEPAAGAGDADFARAAIAAGLVAAEAEPEPEEIPTADMPDLQARQPTVPEPAAAAPRRPEQPNPTRGRGPAMLTLAKWKTSPFRPERDRLLALMETGSDQDSRDGARLDLARLYLAWDLAPEALALLTGNGVSGSTDQRALAAAAAVLAQPDHEAAGWLTAAEALSRSDGPLWAAIAAVRQGRGADAAPYLPAAHRALGAQPAPLRRRFALDLLGLTASAGLDGYAREMAKLVEEGAPTDGERAELHLHIGTLHARAGRMDLALAQWDRAAALSGDAAGLARLAAARHRHDRGEMEVGPYRALLIEMLDLRRGGELEFRALADLVALESAQSRSVPALAALRLLDARHPRHPDLETHRATAVPLLARLAEEGATVPLAERAEAFLLGRDLIPHTSDGWALRRGVAKQLARHGLLALAADDLQLLSDIAQGADRQAALLDLAALHLAAGQPSDAGAVLARPGAAGPDADRWTVLRAMTLTANGKPAEALALLATAKGPEGDTARADAQWALQRWADAAAGYRALAARRPLDGQEAARLALAAYLAGDASAPAQVLAAHAAALGDGPWAERLRVMAASPGLTPATDQAVRALLQDSRAMSRTLPRIGATGAGAVSK